MGEVEDWQSCLLARRSSVEENWGEGKKRRGTLARTLLDAVLLGAVLSLLGGSDALNAVVVVVLGAGAFLGLPALCRKTLADRHSHRDKPYDGLRIETTWSGQSSGKPRRAESGRH